MPTLTDGKAYKVKARSIDKAGNVSTQISGSFAFDTTAPSVAIDDTSLRTLRTWIWLIVPASCVLTVIIVFLKRRKRRV
jgi:hypothetical protein